MNNDLYSIFTLKRFTIINSEKTKQVYINEKNECFFIELPLEAKQFCDVNPGTCQGEPRFYKDIGKYLTKLYQQGVEAINIKQRNDNRFIRYVITKEDLQNNCYINHTVNQCLSQILITQKKKYFAKLKNEHLIIPVLIVKRQPEQYPTIKYSAVKKSGKSYYILFSTIEEFEEWNKEQVMNHYPLEIDIAKLERIRKKDFILVNPLSNRLIIDSEMMKIIKKGEK